jgi:ABC-type sugar transport system ATPase subunit
MRGITKTFPGVKALDNVSIQVAPGEIHAVVGENGAGKSTLMKVLSGVYPHGSYEGEIHFEGEERRFWSIRDSEDAGIIIIHQELALVPLLSIAENIFLGNECATNGVIDWRETFKRTEELLARVGLKESPTTLVTQLGVGKQQLIEIAKALSKKVKLLILDEPTSSLNETDSDALLGLLLEFKQKGIASILISHKLNEVSKVADKITVLRDGASVSTKNSNGKPVSEAEIVRRHDVQDLELRLVPRSERRRIGQRLHRGVREIDRAEDVFELDHGSLLGRPYPPPGGVSMPRRPFSLRPFDCARCAAGKRAGGPRVEPALVARTIEAVAKHTSGPCACGAGAARASTRSSVLRMRSVLRSCLMTHARLRVLWCQPMT